MSPSSTRSRAASRRATPAEPAAGTPPADLIAARRIELWPIDRPKDDLGNARVHPDAELAALERSIRKYGLTRPVGVDRDGVLVYGHATRFVAKRLGITEIPVVVLEHLTPEQRTALSIADNKIPLGATWDPEKLFAGLELATQAGIELGDIGFDDDELELLALSLMPNTNTAPAPADDEPAAAAKIVTRRGDVWELGDHLLACDDSTAPPTWKQLLSADPARAACVFTDPPYGIDYRTESGKRVANDELVGARLQSKLTAALAHCVRWTKDDAAFYIWHASSHRAEFEGAMATARLRALQEIVWVKPSASPGHTDYQWAHELCFYAAKDGQRPAFHGARDQQSVWRVAAARVVSSSTSLSNGVEVVDKATGSSVYVLPRVPKGKKARRVVLEAGAHAELAQVDGLGSVWEVARDVRPEHPTQKPVELARRALENSTKAGDVVLDPFNGGGSTLIACEQAGRIARAVDLEPRWIDVTVRRWQALTGKRAVLLVGRQAFDELAGGAKRRAR